MRVKKTTADAIVGKIIALEQTRLMLKSETKNLDMDCLISFEVEFHGRPKDSFSLSVRDILEIDIPSLIEKVLKDIGIEFYDEDIFDNEQASEDVEASIIRRIVAAQKVIQERVESGKEKGFISENIRLVEDRSEFGVLTLESGDEYKDPQEIWESFCKNEVEEAKEEGKFH